MSRKYYIDIKNASYEWRIKRFALFFGLRSIPGLLSYMKSPGYQELYSFVSNNRDTVQTWMDELRKETVFAVDWDKDWHAPENQRSWRDLKEKYQLTDL